MSHTKNMIKYKSEKVYLIYELENDNIKFIKNFHDIINEKFYIKKEKDLIDFGLKKNDYLKYELNIITISSKVQQIIFQNKSKLNIINNKLQFIESPKNILVLNDNDSNKNIFKIEKISKEEYNNDKSNNSYSNKDNLKNKENNLIIGENNNDSLNNKINSNECNPFIEALFICFFNIKNIKCNFPNGKEDGNNIINLINNFMRKDKIMVDLIKKIEEKIIEINPQLIIDLNFEKLINFILDKLHDELNNKTKNDLEIPKEEYDVDSIYNNFRKYYFSQNESFIQKIFFGIKETIIYYKCCELIKYKFDIIKYMSFDSEIVNKENNIQKLFSEWEKHQYREKLYCNMCAVETDSSIHNILWDSPELLIIIIKDNKNKIEIDLRIKIKTIKYEYNFSSGIFLNEKEININKYNVIYKDENNKYFIINYDKKSKEGIEINQINHLLLYPCVLFYQNDKGIINETKNDLVISNNRIISHILTESNYFQNESNDFMKNSNLLLKNSNYNYNIYNNMAQKNTNIRYNNETENNNLNCNRKNNYNLDKNNIYNENKIITLYFIFECGRQLYIKVNESLIFSQVIKLLEDKYFNNKNIQSKEFIYNKNKIDLNKTVKENGLEENSNIKII